MRFETDEGAAAKAAIGLIVLASDETMEPEIASLMPKNGGVALYHARIPSAPTVTPETLRAMEAELPSTAALLPDRPFDVIGYGCTSGATLIGPERVTELVSGARETKAMTDPLTATIAACEALGVRRIGFLTPYVAEVSAAMRAALEAAGLEIAGFVSFEEAEERVVARISQRSTAEAICALGGTEGVEAVFASCTNLRAFDVIAACEARIGKPVISSNLALGWSLLGHAGVAPARDLESALLTLATPQID
ncbi:MAG: Asp/Glu racemase [Pseudomonadota bacterium]